MKQWTYVQSNGELISPEGETVYHGYSGLGIWKNDPASEALVDKGPIPAGQWLIDLRPIQSPKTGPYTLILTPNGHPAHERSAFRIHGDSATHPGAASHGCIIMPRGVRERIVAAGVVALNVIARPLPRVAPHG